MDGKFIINIPILGFGGKKNSLGFFMVLTQKKRNRK